jgi:hypothetical protein
VRGVHEQVARVAGDLGEQRADVAVVEGPAALRELGGHGGADVVDAVEGVQVPGPVVAQRPQDPGGGPAVEGAQLHDPGRAGVPQQQVGDLGLEVVELGDHRGRRLPQRPLLGDHGGQVGGVGAVEPRHQVQVDHRLNGSR